MKKEIADMWIADLRSGPKQRTGRLGDDEKGYCCLGRLHVVLGLSTYGYRYLSAEAMELSGVKTSTGYFGDSNGGFCLSQFNDEGLTFEEIADIIEENWERL
jgi:hypothetical protein